MKENQALAAVTNWYDRRPLRERAILLLCLVAVLIFIWDLVVLKPLDKQRKLVQTQVTQVQNSLTELATREQIAESRRSFDPDRENRQRLMVLQAELDKVHAQLATNLGNLISPQEMPELLKELLRKQHQLQLLSLENLPAEDLKIDEKIADKTQQPELYRHRLRMEFAGDYLSTLKYLRELEKLPRNMVWDELEIETLEYPRAKVRLEVYTLSLTEGWIGG
jgi:MSHA biogenesis protein MshJ